MRFILVSSVVLNMAAGYFVADIIRGRGGLSYVKRILSEDHKPSVNPAYDQLTSIFRMIPAQENAVIFAGDSITQGFPWGEVFGLHVLNRGIGGDTSYGLLDRIDALAASHPKAIFLMIGTNDWVAARLEPYQTAENIRKSIERLRKISPTTTIYLQSILPSASPKKTAWVRETNALIRPITNRYTIMETAPIAFKLEADSKVIYVDLFSRFVKDDRLDPKYTSDGIHLNGTGYAAWISELQKCCSKHISTVVLKALK